MNLILGSLAVALEIFEVFLGRVSPVGMSVQTLILVIKVFDLFSLKWSYICYVVWVLELSAAVGLFLCLVSCK